MSDVCSNCGRGAEACGYCHDLERIDWETICDCGLADFGAHLLLCTDRENYRWVIPLDHEAAKELLA